MFQDVSATGSTNQVITETLDGFFIGLEPDPKIDLIKTAEQTIREYLDTKPTQYLQNVNLLSLPGAKTILATLFDSKNLSSEEIARLELKIRQRSGEDKISLIIRHMDLDLSDRFGTLYYEGMALENINSKQEIAINAIKSFLRAEIEKSDYFITDIIFTIRDGVYHIMLELVGPKLYSREELDQLRKNISEISKDPVEIYVRSRPEVVLTKNGYTTFNDLQKKFLKQAESLYKKELNNLIEGTL